jgi:hypothetical protein
MTLLVCRNRRRHAEKTQVFYFIAHQTSLEAIDLGKQGDSPGDQVVETETLQHGKQIGPDVLNCVAIAVSAQGIDALCHGALILRGGQIQFQGETTFATPFTSPSPAGRAAIKTPMASSRWRGRCPTGSTTWTPCGWCSSRPTKATGP